MCQKGVEVSQFDTSRFAIGTQAYYPGQAYNTPAMLRLAASISTARGRLLDIGCGDGKLLHLLSECYPDLELAGMTVSEEERLVCGEKFDVQVGDMHDLPWKDGSFDAAVSRHSLEHSISPLTALFEVNRVLRLDGGFHVVVPAPVSEWVMKWKGHFSVLPKPMWEKLFDDAGFAVEHYEDGDWLASFSMQCEPEMRFVLRKVRDIRSESISSQKVDDMPIITEQEPSSAALSTLVERKIVVVLHNLVLFDAIRPVVAGFRRDVKFLIPHTGDSGFEAMGERTRQGIKAAGFEVELVTLPANVRCDIELSPYPYATRNVCHAKWRVRFMYGLAKEAWNFSLENNVYYDFALTYGDYDSRVLSAYTTPVCIGNPKITKVAPSSRVRGDRQVLLYLPTYGPTSSIEAVCSIQKQLKAQYRVIAKAHHGTTYLEPERVTQLQSWVDELAHHDTSLSSLLARADVVLSDGSGAIFDAIAAGVPIAVFQDKVFGGLGGTVSLEERLVRDAQIPATNSIEEIVSTLARAVQTDAAQFESLQRELFVALGDEAADRGGAFLTELLAGSQTLDLFAVARRLLMTRLAEGMAQRGARIVAERRLDESYRNLTDRLLADVQDSIVKLAERNGQIVSLNQAVGERDGQIVSLNQAVGERDGQVASLGQAIAERNGQIASLGQAVAERDNLNHMLTHARASLKLMKQSRSWRITTPLRWGTRFSGKISWCLARFASVRQNFGMRAAVRRSVNFLQARAPSSGLRKVLGDDSRVMPLFTADGAVEALRTFGEHGGDDTSLIDSAPSIFMLVDSFYDGGVERVVIDLCMQLRDSGRACKILVAKNGGRSAHEAKSHGIEVIEFGGDHGLLKNFVSSTNGAVVITHHCYFSLECFHHAGVPIVEVIHNAYHWQRGNFKIAEIRDQLISKFVAVSDFVRNYSVKELNIESNRIVLINNGLNNIDLIRPPLELLRLKRVQTYAEPVLLHVANLHPQKNHRLIVSAFSYVKRVYPKARLIMAGAMNDYSELRTTLLADIERLGIGDSIELVGALDRRKLSRAMASAHIGLLPSMLEGFSIVTLEYSFFGLPSVLSDTGAAGELRNAYGHVEIADGCDLSPSELNAATIESALKRVSEKTILSLANAIQKILDEYPQYLDKALGAADQFSSYSIAHTAGEYSHLLQLLESEGKH